MYGRAAFAATLLLVMEIAQGGQVRIILAAVRVDVIHLVGFLGTAGVGVIPDMGTPVTITLQDALPSLVPTRWEGLVPP